jgi:hypothetical protein
VFLEGTGEGTEVVLHVLLDAQVFLLLLLLHDLALAFLLFDGGVRSELEFHLGLLDEEIEDGGREFLEECAIEFEFLRVVDFVELDDEVAV